MANTYSLVITNITDTAVDIKVASTTNPSTTSASLTVAVFKVGETGGISQPLSDPGTNSGQLVGTASFTSLAPSTQYIVRLTGVPNVTTTSASFATKIDRDTPRSATQEQWEDISSKVKAKADNSAFTGTDGVDPGTAGLVPAPATTDAGKFLKADGTWDVAGGGGPTVVQTTGTSQTDVMSQNATTSIVFKDPSTLQIVKIGANATAGNNRNVAIGHYSTANNDYSVAVGGQSYAPNTSAVAVGGTCNAQSNYSVAIGRNATVYSNALNSTAIGANSKANTGYEHSVALGDYASTTRTGEINVGTGSGTYGYNSTSYRVIGGVHDGQDLHDAATVAQGNTLATAAPDTSTVGVLGQLWTDTTNMHTYQCTAISGSTYTWTQRW